MRFASAFNWMKNGKPMMCAGFVGYWYWDKANAEVIMVTKANEKVPMKDSNNWDFTLGFINSDEWTFYDGPADPRESDVAKMLEEPTPKQEVFPLFPVVNELNAHLFGGEARTVVLFDGTEITTAPLLVNGPAFDLIGISNMTITAEASGYFPQDLELTPRLTNVNVVVDEKIVTIETGDTHGAAFTPNAMGDALFLTYASEEREVHREEGLVVLFTINVTGYMKRATGRAELVSNVNIKGLDDTGEYIDLTSTFLDRMKARVTVESVEIGGELIAVTP